ncbi:hypothetical protein [Longispora albida]|uniref:hypothetical protein n=1 Tax=Longispora albida TaxID=203523 RepID=UPI000368CFDE|nr:hypothetical protein [Longispora albida]
MTDALFSTPPAKADGLLDGRLLQSVQLLRIARHTGHVIRIAGGGLTVLTGRGPGGASNGAGKSTVAESLLLLSADRQWTRGGAGAKAIGMLFSEKDAQQLTGSLGNAPHGYIVSFWAPADRPASAPVTVWMRVQREGTGPKLQVRVAEGERFARGNSEQEILTSAERIWEELRATTTSYTPDKFGLALFGSAPGSIGYVRNRGADDTPDTGLLSIVDGRKFHPAALARELIDLCGLTDQISLEQSHRRAQAELDAQLAAEITDAERQHSFEEIRLNDIKARARAREARTTAEGTWKIYLAAGVRYYTTEHAKLTSQIDAGGSKLTSLRERRDQQQRIADGTDLREASRMVAEAKTGFEAAQKTHTATTQESAKADMRLSTTRTQLAKLAPALALAGTTTTTEAAQRVQAAQAARDAAMAGKHHTDTLLSRARQEHAAAAKGLDGAAGQYKARLAGHGISAVPLSDLLDLRDDQRDHWEPRLAPLADAVTIGRDDLSRALEVLGDQPGAVLVTIDDADPSRIPARRPGGAGQHPLDALLDDLARRWQPASPAAVQDLSAGMVILGGFDKPQTGRAARLAALQARVQELEAAAGTASAKLSAAEQTLAAASRLATAVKQAAQHSQLKDEESELAATAAALQDKLAAEAEALNTAQGAHATAAGRLQALTGQRESAQKEVRRIDEEIEQTGKARQLAMQARSGLPLEEFRVAFARQAGTGADPDQVPGSASSPHRARTQAARELLRTIDLLPDLGSAGDSPHGAQLLALRAWCENTPDEETITDFDTHAGPLDTWLKLRSAGDEAIAADIAAVRAERAEHLAVAAQRSSQNKALARTAEENAKKIIRAKFRDVEQQLQAMWQRAGRHAIKLKVSEGKPASPDEPITWQLGITWQNARDVPARSYGDKANTAEYVLVHTLLAASALSSIANPRGRLIVIDEFGQNLDMVNIPAVADVLKQIATQYQITIVLACQDVAAPLIAEYCDVLIEVQHVSSAEPLNRPPMITAGPAHPELIHLLADAWRVGRPLL